MEFSTRRTLHAVKFQSLQSLHGFLFALEAIAERVIISTRNCKNPESGFHFADVYNRQQGAQDSLTSFPCPIHDALSGELDSLVLLRL